MPGIFLSLDGVDGAGKSTQCRLLADWLRGQGLRVVQCRDPGGTAAGDRIRELLLDARNSLSPVAEVFLYMASRTLLVDDVIRPALAKGEIVLTDRFLLASAVYQGHAGDLPAEKIWEMGRLATGGLLPGLTFVLDLPVRTGLARKSDAPDRMEAKGLEFHERVRQGFLTEAKRQPERIRVLDARQPIDDLQSELRLEVSRVLEGAAGP